MKAVLGNSGSNAADTMTTVVCCWCFQELPETIAISDMIYLTGTFVFVRPTKGILKTIFQDDWGVLSTVTCRTQELAKIEGTILASEIRTDGKIGMEVSVIGMLPTVT
uniref:Uncharacterized protein n=1 Tax=Vespula pensylvanica TaxID=30213 RepID=A0A834PBE3_VESPE|nr:hypothetical protein H0235_003054 [Vespula pensylvanica]